MTRNYKLKVNNLDIDIKEENKNENNQIKNSSYI